MPSLVEHVQKSRHNEELAQLLAGNETYHDWAVTALFYAALHYVDAVLTVSRVDPSSHEKRHSAMAANDTLRHVFVEYRLLETMSKNARYFAVPITLEDWHKVNTSFEALRTHILSRLRLPAES